MAATKLVITAVNAGVNPKAGVSFSVSVQSQNAASAATNPTANTGVALTVTTGTGVILGTSTGTILTSQNTIALSVAYSKPEVGVVFTASATSGDVLTAGTSTFTVGAGSQFGTQPIYVAGDMAVSYRTSALNPSGQKGFRALRVLVTQADATVASVPGDVTIKDPAATAGRDVLLAIPVVAATQAPALYELGSSNAGWRDFIVSGATAAKVALQIYYKD